MPLTPEQRKDYNKTYYAMNREKALKKACEQVICPCCDRRVTKNRLTEHLKTNLCLRTQQRENDINNRIHNINEIVNPNV